jgi:serine/threonine protein kinase
MWKASIVALLLGLGGASLRGAEGDNFGSLMNDTQTSFLDSLLYYDAARKAANNVTRYEGSNLDHFTIPSTQESVALCHLNALLPFTFGDYIPEQSYFDVAATIALAAHHLNVGDGSIVPEVEGLDRRCNVRFTVEFSDTEYQAGMAVRHVVEQTSRTPGDADHLLPCAFIGAVRSAVTIPTSMVSGLLGYPQVSAESTSPDLDDKSQFPLFARTVPSDEGNTVPIIIYIRKVLQVTHLAVINVNDAYGNSYVGGMRKAAELYAPDMEIHQIPLEEESESIATAIDILKNTEYRFVFCLVFTGAIQDAVLTEAYNKGVAGNGLHNWLFGDSFDGVLDGRTFDNGSPLHLSYRGSGLLEVSGGVPGIPSYDIFAAKVARVNNPTDMEYLGNLFPVHDDPRYGSSPPFINDKSFLTTLRNGFVPFSYEAAIALGLAACDAYEQNMTFSGQDHYDHLVAATLTGVSGKVLFDNTTGSRDPNSALNKVVNWVEEETSDGKVRFVPVITDLFQNGEWKRQQNYIFNDGTSNLPRDLPFPVANKDGKSVLVIVIAVSVIVVGLLIGSLAVFLFYENKRKQNDAVWSVEKEELLFGDPPKVIGRGTFGLVLLAEYRGTQVAVKRVIPQRSNEIDDEGFDFSAYSSSVVGIGNNMGMKSGKLNTKSAFNVGTTSWGVMSFSPFAINPGVRSTAALSSGREGVKREAAMLKKMKEAFMEEMRHLSKLRHPCITTILGKYSSGLKAEWFGKANSHFSLHVSFNLEMFYSGAVTSGDEPQLVMEFMQHGSLYDLLHNETMVLEGEILLPILRDVSQGLRFLHSARPPIIHGDLKAANILVDNKFRAKVADFGLSSKSTLGSVGTPFWMAPELLRHESSNTAASDIYSFGITLYEVYSRRDPYEGEDPDNVLRLVADKSAKKRPSAPKHMCLKLKSIMDDCVEDEADQRPTFQEVDSRLTRIDAETADVGQTCLTKVSTVSLFDIFPRHIAEALRDGRAVDAEHRDSVTIFFSDIVGFTTISSRYVIMGRPHEHVRLLTCRAF